MKRVLRQFEGAAGHIYQYGDYVDSSDWRLAKQLESQKYIGDGCNEAHYQRRLVTQAVAAGFDATGRTETLYPRRKKRLRYDLDPTVSHRKPGIERYVNGAPRYGEPRYDWVRQRDEIVGIVGRAFLVTLGLRRR